MSDWPTPLGPFTPASVLSPFWPTGGLSGLSGGTTLGSGTWPTANLALYVPVRLDQPHTVTHASVMNGSAVSGNFDVGLYSVDGTRLLSTGSTAQSGTSAPQNVALAAATRIPEGIYWLALAFDNTTATTIRMTYASVEFLRIAGLLQQASAFALPATATLATLATNYVPAFGLAPRAL